MFSDPTKGSCRSMTIAGMIVVTYIPGKEGTTMPYRWPKVKMRRTVRGVLNIRPKPMIA